MTDFPAPLKTSPERPRSPLWTALGLAWEFGYLIVTPLLVFALGGRFLDRRYGTSPWLFLAGMALAVMLTTVFLVRKFTKLVRDLERESTKPKS